MHQINQKIFVIEAIGNDLKMSIDDLIHEIKNIKKEIEEIKKTILKRDSTP